MHHAIALLLAVLLALVQAHLGCCEPRQSPMQPLRLAHYVPTRSMLIAPLWPVLCRAAPPPQFDSLDIYAVVSSPHGGVPPNDLDFVTFGPSNLYNTFLRPLTQGWNPSQLDYSGISIPALAERVVIRATFQQPTGTFVERRTGHHLRSGEWWALPYQISPGNFDLFFDSGIDGSQLYKLTYSKCGWSQQLQNAAGVAIAAAVPGQSVSVRFEAIGTGPCYTQSTWLYTIAAADALLMADTAEAKSFEPVVVDLTVPVHPPSTGTIQLTLTRKYQEGQGTFTHNSDDVMIGNLPPIVTIPIVPNGACVQDDGHLVLGRPSGASDSSVGPILQSSTSMTGLDIPNLEGTRALTVCFWLKPFRTQNETQVILSLDSTPGGDEGAGELVFGIFGATSGASPNVDRDGQPGAVFMRNMAQYNTGEPPVQAAFYTSPSAPVDVFQWQHVCFVYVLGSSYVYGSAIPSGRSSVQVFLNGLPAAKEVTNRIDWPGSQVAVTLGALSNLALPYHGRLDELIFFGSAATSLDILTGYRTNFNFVTTARFTATTARFTFRAGTFNGDNTLLYDEGESFVLNTINGERAYHSQYAELRCSGLAPQMSSRNGRADRDCLQPFPTNRLRGTGVGRATQNDGQLLLPASGNSMWRQWFEVPLTAANGDEPNPSALQRRTFNVCFWVYRASNVVSKPQVIFSFGSSVNPEQVRWTVAYEDLNLRISMGTARGHEDALIALRTKDGNDLDRTDAPGDVGMWVHWCLLHNWPDIDFPASTNILMRNGRPIYRQELQHNWLDDRFINPMPNLDGSDLTLCIGCIDDPAWLSAPTPLDGALDEFRFYLTESATMPSTIADYFRSGAFPEDSSGLDTLFSFRFDEGVAATTLNSWTYTSNGAPYRSVTFDHIGAANEIFFTNGTMDFPCGYTCLAIGSEWSQPGEDERDTLHPLAGGMSPSTIAVNATTGEGALHLNSHSYTFANADFSYCYWVRRDASSLIPPVGPGASASEISYDLSLGDKSDMNTYFWSGWARETEPDHSGEYYVFTFSSSNGDDMGLVAPASSSALLRGGGASDLNRWVFLCGTYRSIGANGTPTGLRKLYRNGILIGEDQPAMDLQRSQPMYVGQRAGDGRSTLPGVNHYDELLVWTRVVTTEEIRALLNSQMSVTALVAPLPVMNFHFDRSAPGPRSSGANGDLLTCWPSCQWGTEADRVMVPLSVPMVCPVGTQTNGAVQMFGHNLGASSGPEVKQPLIYRSVDLDELHLTNASFTVGLWAMRTDDAPSVLMQFGCSSSWYRIQFLSPVSTAVTSSVSAAQLSVSPSAFPPLGVWFHLVVRWRQVDSSLTISIDNDRSMSNTTTEDWTLQCKDEPNLLSLGAAFNGDAPFTGFVDELALWNRALSDGELTAWYKGQSFLSPGPGHDVPPLARGLQLHYSFGAQAGQSVRSLDVGSIAAGFGPFHRNLTSRSPLVEPLWYAPGTTTFLALGDAVGSTPMTEGPVLCLPSPLDGRLFDPRWSVPPEYAAGVPANYEINVDLVWLQSLGRRGITIDIYGPEGTTITPSTIVYAAGADPRIMPVRSFKVSSRVAQYVTLRFVLSGPEALQLESSFDRSDGSRPITPSMSFAVLSDVINNHFPTEESIQLYCWQQGDAGNLTVPVTTQIFDGAEFANQLVQDLPDDVVNTCRVRVTRRWHNATLFGPLTLNITDELSLFSWAYTGQVRTIMNGPLPLPPDGSPSSTFIYSAPFWLHLDHHYAFELTSHDRVYRWSMMRMPFGDQQNLAVNSGVNLATSIQRNVSITGMIDLPASHTSNGTLRIASVYGVTIEPNFFTFEAGQSAHFEFTYMLPVVHPRLQSSWLFFEWGGYGGEFYTANGGQGITIQDAEYGNSVDLLTLIFQANGANAPHDFEQHVDLLSQGAACCAPISLIGPFHQLQGGVFLDEQTPSVVKYLLRDPAMDPSQPDPGEMLQAYPSPPPLAAQAGTMMPTAGLRRSFASSRRRLLSVGGTGGGGDGAGSPPGGHNDGTSISPPKIVDEAPPRWYSEDLITLDDDIDGKSSLSLAPNTTYYLWIYIESQNLVPGFHKFELYTVENPLTLSVLECPIALEVGSRAPLLPPVQVLPFTVSDSMTPQMLLTAGESCRIHMTKQYPTVDPYGLFLAAPVLAVDGKDMVDHWPEGGAEWITPPLAIAHPNGTQFNLYHADDTYTPGANSFILQSDVMLIDQLDARRSYLLHILLTDSYGANHSIALMPGMFEYNATLKANVARDFTFQALFMHPAANASRALTPEKSSSLANPPDVSKFVSYADNTTRAESAVGATSQWQLWLRVESFTGRISLYKFNLDFVGDVAPSSTGGTTPTPSSTGGALVSSTGVGADSVRSSSGVGADSVRSSTGAAAASASSSTGRKEEARHSSTGALATMSSSSSIGTAKRSSTGAAEPSSTGAPTRISSSTGASSTGAQSSSSSTGAANFTSSTGVAPPLVLPPAVEYTPPVPVTPAEVTCTTLGVTCMYGSGCSVRGSGASASALCTCAADFRGPLCQFGIMSCEGCTIPPSPRNQSGDPIWTPLTFVGVGFERIVAVNVGAYRMTPDMWTRFVLRNVTNSIEVQSALASRAWPPSIAQKRDGFHVIDLQVNLRKIRAPSVATSTPVSKHASIQRHHVTNFAVALGSHVAVTFEVMYDGLTVNEYPGLIYQAASNCTKAGLWKADPQDENLCLPCPEGGYCPGGGRVWPIKNYWSWNELTAPTRCELENVCPGTPLNAQSAYEVARDTQECAAGYTGVKCAVCADGFYQSGVLCLPCASAQSEEAQLAGLLILGIIAMSFLAASVAFSSATHLGFLVAMYVLFQQAIATGKASSTKWPSQFRPLSDFFNAIGIINFDLSFMKPGCVAPTYSFIDTLYGTILFIFVAWGMFVAACVIRRQLFLIRLKARYFLADQSQNGGSELFGDALQDTAIQAAEKVEANAQRARQRAADEKKISLDFKRRLIHSTLIVFSLFYLKMTTLALNGLRCTIIPRATTEETDTATMAVLVSDASVECWTGRHLGASIVIAAILLLHTFLFPVLCFALLTRAFAPIILRHRVYSQGYVAKFLLALGYEKPRESTAAASQPALKKVTSISTATVPAEGASSIAASAFVDPVKVESEEEIAARDTREYAERHAVHMALFGYLFRGVSDESYFFRLLAFPVSFGVTCSLVFISDVTLRTLVLGLIYAFTSITHTFLVPFIEWHDNVINSSVQIGSLIYTLGVLSLQDPQNGNSDFVHTSMIVLGLVAVVCICQFVYVVRYRSQQRQKIFAVEQDDTDKDLGLGGEEEERRAKLQKQASLAKPDTSLVADDIASPSQAKFNTFFQEAIPTASVAAAASSSGATSSSSAMRVEMTPVKALHTVRVEPVAESEAASSRSFGRPASGRLLPSPSVASPQNVSLDPTTPVVLDSVNAPLTHGEGVASDAAAPSPSSSPSPGLAGSSSRPSVGRQASAWAHAAPVLARQLSVDEDELNGASSLSTVDQAVAQH